MHRYSLLTTTTLAICVVAGPVTAQSSGTIAPVPSVAPCSQCIRTAPLPLDLIDGDLWERSRVTAMRANDRALEGIDLAFDVGDIPMSRIDRSAPHTPTAWATDDPADSLYRVARESLNSGDYRRAAQLFAQIERQYPASAYRPDAAYWRAFALYRIGGLPELHEALQALDSVRVSMRVPVSQRVNGTAMYTVTMRSSQLGAALLATRIRGALAARGDASAAAQVAQAAGGGTPSCDEEDNQLRVEALNALVQLDPKSADPTIAKVLARRDECSASLRRGAVALIGRSTDTHGTDLLVNTARTDPSWEVRAEAVRWLGRAPDDRATAVLTQIATAQDQRSSVQRTAIRALTSQDSPAARQALRTIITRTDLPSDVRVTALHYAGRTDMPISELGKLYDTSADRQVRQEVVQLLERRPEPEASDKLIEIARIGTDPEMRRSAIAALSRRKDPRTTKLLMDILDK